MRPRLMTDLEWKLWALLKQWHIANHLGAFERCIHHRCAQAVAAHQDAIRYAPKEVANG